MITWRNYTDDKEKHTVTGELLIVNAIYSPQLDNNRHIYVWLPPSYRTDETKHYPVMYMHDGDNLFDGYATISSEWHVDEVMTDLAKDGIEAIIVGLPNMGMMRMSEYCPYDEVKPNLGDSYMQFIVETIKPMIDSEFRTLPDKENTGIAGSSMGGLISLYGFLSYQDVFSMCGSFSPVFWFNADSLYQLVLSNAKGDGRVFLDVGTKEGHVYARIASETAPFYGSDPDDAYRDGVRQLRDGLLEKGYRDDTVLYIEEKCGHHNEYMWARHLPDALRFLLSGTGA